MRLDARQGLVAMASQVVSFVRGTFPAVNLPDDQSKSPIELLPLCWSQWPAASTPPEPVLLILDDQRGDAESYGAERRLLTGLPPRFRRLITQREPAPTGAKAIDLPLLQREASLELLALQAGEGGPERLDAEPQAADGLCAEVGDLPLALVLLGARLAERPDLRPSQLLEELRAKGAEAKALRQAHPELGAQRGVVEALLISWEPLSEAAKSLGVLLGVMAPAVIPWELVEACRLPGQEVEEGSAFGEQQSELRRAQLLERVGDGMYRLHPLVRQFIRLQSRDQGDVAARWRKQLAIVVAELCREKIPEILSFEQIRAVNLFVPHIQQVADTEIAGLCDRDLFWPTAGLGNYFGNQALFADALHWRETCLQACEARWGPYAQQTAAAINNLAELLRTMGQARKAKELFKRALKITQANSGLNSRDAFSPLTNMALLLKDTGCWKEAEPLLEKALALAETNYGKDHPKVAIGLNNLAQLLFETGRLKEAERLMERSLGIDEHSYGPDHPKLAIRFNNLALLLQATGRSREAESLMRRRIAIYETGIGERNPDMGTALNNLAQLLQSTGRWREAEPLMERALAIDETNYGLDHPKLAVRLNNLALLRQGTGRMKEAEILLKRSLAINEANYGPDQPKVAKSLNNLALLLKAGAQMEEAELLMVRALAITEASYGTQHPEVAIRLNNLAGLVQAMGRLNEAKLLRLRALAIDEVSYGSNHPTVAKDLNNLAHLLQCMGCLKEAGQLMGRAFSIILTRFGMAHSRTQEVKVNYIIILEALGLPESEVQASINSLISAVIETSTEKAT